jgi:hypothetical protein
MGDPVRVDQNDSLADRRALAKTGGQSVLAESRTAPFCAIQKPD